MNRVLVLFAFLLSAICAFAQGIVSSVGDAPYSTASLVSTAEVHYLRPQDNPLPDVELRAQSSSYIVVPLVGVLALGLLQTARYRRRK